jgi:hypothetical protein
MITIGEICYETYPCQHRVRFSDGTHKLMLGPDILQLCSKMLTGTGTGTGTDIIAQQSFSVLKHLLSHYNSSASNELRKLVKYLELVDEGATVTVKME